jgi:hypothetical protein
MPPPISTPTTAIRTRMSVEPPPSAAAEPLPGAGVADATGVADDPGAWLDEPALAAGVALGDGAGAVASVSFV